MPSVRSIPSSKVRKITEILSRTYPAAHCELDFANPLQLLVAVILSAQCTDKRVNLVTPALFQKYRTAFDFASSSQEALEREIHSTGFYRNKAKNIRACCQALVDHHQGKVPDTMEALTSLAGVGRKTANVILHVAHGKNEGVCVDTHVLRLSQRLGLSRHSTPEQVEQDLMQAVPRKDWGQITHLLIWHGRRRCMARNPDCENCELNHLCPASKKVSFPSKK